MAGTAPARPRPCRGYPAVRLAAPPAARMRYVGHGSDVPASVPGASRRSVGHRPRPRPGGTRYTPAPRTARAPEGRATRPRPGGTRSQVRRPPAARRRYVGHGSGVPASVPGTPRRSVGRRPRPRPGGPRSVVLRPGGPRTQAVPGASRRSVGHRPRPRPGGARSGASRAPEERPPRFATYACALESVPGTPRRSVDRRPRPRPGGPRYTPAPRRDALPVM